MTYLELVNNLLKRLREDTVLTVEAESDDPVVELAKLFINDAKDIVEDAWRWNAQRYTWEAGEALTMDGDAATTPRYSLTNSDYSATIKHVYRDDGALMKPTTADHIHKLHAQNATTGDPYWYAADGADVSGNLTFKVYPSPPPGTIRTATVHGFRRRAPLALNADVLLVPSKPVQMFALAFAAEERGEVGGRTSQQIMQTARTYLNDAIQLDADHSDYENTWTTP